MDERIREILRAIEKWTCGKREDKSLTHLRPNSGMGGGGGKGEEEIENKKGDLKKESLREKDSTFSLNFSEIGTVVSSGARGRVQPHGKGFA